MTLSNSPAIILVRPQMPENIGACARAMANFGLMDLRLVEPREGWPNHEAERNSAGALQEFVGVRVFSTLPDAISDLHVTYATTARTRDINKRVYSPAEAADEIRSADVKTGLVFGPERTGLTNDDLQYCQHILTFPVNPQFSSLNIAQAVLLMAYTLFQQGNDLPARTISSAIALPAPQAELEKFFLRLEKALEDQGFYKSPHLKETNQRNVRAMMMRAEFTEQELSTLQGILSAFIQKR